MPSPSPHKGLASPRLRRVAHERRGTQTTHAATEQQEHCELCNAPLPAEHRHLVDLEAQRLLCACRPCSLLFDRRAAGGGHYRLVPDRRLRLDDFVLDDLAWEQLRIPVDMAFFFHSSAAGRVMAFYPSPMGATESRLELTAWLQIARANPLLETMEDDVEALLVNRADTKRGHWLVPIDDCYRLVAVIRTNWRGFSGGKEVWLQIERFFDDLNRRARPERPHEPASQAAERS